MIVDKFQMRHFVITRVPHRATPVDAWFSLAPARQPLR
jgi:hypothetical protein